MKYKSKEIITISNGISLLRFFLVIPLWFLLDNYDSANVRYITFALCLFAAATDMLDGYLARKLNQVTEVGKIIDPLADKAAMAVIVVKLFMLKEISAFYFFTIIGRDLIIFLGGIYVSKKLGRVLPSNKLGKITVLVLGTVVLQILIGADRDGTLFQFFYYLSILLMFISLIAYIYRANEFIRNKKNESI